MARFSQRNGFKPARDVVQIDTLDDETRMGLWNMFYLFSFQSYDQNSYLTLQNSLAVGLWIDWHNPFEKFEKTLRRSFLDLLKEVFMSGSLPEVFDLIEATVDDLTSKQVGILNTQLEKYLVGYRMVGKEIQPVTETAEVEAIEGALKVLEPFNGARQHLSNALSLLSDRENPQYANVIKESISAVEAIARHYTGEKTLGAALKKLESSGVPAHGALTTGWSMLFGYANDEPGIRHGSIKDSEADEALATYFVVTCSSMVGYLIKKAGDAISA